MSVNKVQLANGETIIDISDSTVTPETLAEGVTAHDASGQKITGKMVPGGGSSVQSDWNQNDSSAADFIKNKPFGESPTGGDTLYWDGNTDGKVNILGMFVHVSDTVLTKSDFTNGAKAVVGGKEFTFGDADIIEGAIDGIGLAFNELGISLNETEAETGGVPAGTYLIHADKLNYVASLTISGYTGFPVTKKMEEKYLPDTAVQNGDKELVLTSSSGKVFSITVLDDGTLTATEQTAS